jgi:hypothetical protein
MSDAPSASGRRTTRTVIGLIVAGLVVLLLAANVHLVYVSLVSQPECVAHLKQGDAAQAGSFRAAKSACSPGARS